MLQATDTFDQMYSRLLAKRLLDVENCVIERELEFIGANRAEFGE